MKTLEQSETLEELDEWLIENGQQLGEITYQWPALQRAYDLGWNEAIEAAAVFLDWHGLCQSGKIVKTPLKQHPAMSEAIRALKRPTQEKGE